MDVLREIASGKSNREIAEALYIGEKTVKTHITNILSKLHLADRTQAAVFAWQEGIVRREKP
jgi:NarL family two-component system response regulator LiaR